MERNKKDEIGKFPKGPDGETEGFKVLEPLFDTEGEPVLTNISFASLDLEEEFERKTRSCDNRPDAESEAVLLDVIEGETVAAETRRNRLACESHRRIKNI